MKIFNIHTYFYLFIVLLLTACTDTEPIPTPPPSAVGDLLVKQAIQDVLDQAAQAMQEQDLDALEQLLDPDADSGWISPYTQFVRSFTTSLESDGQSANIGQISIELQRVMITNQWALAAIILIGQDSEEDTPHQTYSYQTLYNRDGEGWQLTSPVAQAWGQQQELTLNCLKLTYYTFDEPYVQAAAPSIEQAYNRLEEDLAIPFCEENGPMSLGIVPKILWGTVAGEKIKSPLTFEFPLSLASTPEDFLLGLIMDTLAHMLLQRSYDDYGKEMSRTQLSHIVLQWEVDTATGRNMQQHLLDQVSQSEDQVSLEQLLDPTVMIQTGDGMPQRDLLSYFIKETYGRASFARFVQATFETDSADELTRAAFGVPLEVVEEAWQAWLFLSAPTTSASSLNWQTYREAEGLFTIDYPPGWSVQEAGSAQFHQIWQFNNPEMAESTITIIKYLTRIPTEMVLEEWITQNENSDFEFERLQSEPSELNGRDAYLIHDRFKPPQRDSYIIYIRCLETVWSLHLLDRNIDSEIPEDMYDQMIATFKLVCGDGT